MPVASAELVIRIDRRVDLASQSAMLMMQRGASRFRFLAAARFNYRHVSRRCGSALRYLQDTVFREASAGRGIAQVARCVIIEAAVARSGTIIAIVASARRLLLVPLSASRFHVLHDACPLYRKHRKRGVTLCSLRSALLEIVSLAIATRIPSATILSSSTARLQLSSLPINLPDPMPYEEIKCQAEPMPINLSRSPKTASCGVRCNRGIDYTMHCKTLLAQRIPSPRDRN